MSNQSTVFPILVEVNAARNVTLLETFTSYMTIVSGFTQELQTYLNYENSQYASDFANANAQVLKTVDSQKLNIDPEFLAYYIKQYEKSVQAVKDIVAPTNNSIYSNLGDSIGILANVTPTLNDSVIPLNDITGSTYSTVQIYPTSLTNKLSPTTKNIAISLNKTATTLYRNNLINIQTVWATTTDAHGSNLITDFNSYLRMRDIAPVLVSRLNNDFDQLFSLVTFYCNLNDFSGYNPQDPSLNLQTLPRLRYNENVEGIGMELDLLGKKITTARKDITIKQRLFAPAASVTSNTAASNIFTQVPAPTKSINPIPVNSTAAPALVPTTPIVPTPVTTSLNTEQKSTANLQASEQTKKTTPKTNVATTPNPTIAKLPTSTPEYSRDVFASAGPSPLAAIGAVHDLVCRASNLSLKGSGKFNLPSLPDGIKNFNFKNAFTSLAIKLEQQLVKMLLSLIPPLPKIPNLKKIFSDFAKTYFTCNPGNKK